MTMLALYTFVGLVTIVALSLTLQRLLSRDRLTALAAKHRSPEVTSTADMVDGRQHIQVALTLERTKIYFENQELQAAIELERIDEVEYDDELATGTQVEQGRVLRLRSHGHAYEFILDDVAAKRWLAHLPPHRMNEPGIVHASR
jgi:hypothetical protein